MNKQTASWVQITEKENIPPREGRSIRVGGRDIAIFNLGARFVAMENRCPHRGGPLADGIVSATGETVTVTCPLHNWRVAVDCGRVVKPSAEGGACVRTFPVRVDNGIIAVCVAPHAATLAEETAAVGRLDRGDMDFAGLRILSLESRRAEIMEQLIRRYGGEPFVAPSVQEVPFRPNEEIWQWAERLFAGEFNMIVLMTGAGLTYLRDAVVERYSQSAFADALRRLTTVSRGPKPVAVLHELGVKADIIIPEPNTWKEIVPVIAGRPERRITVQEYGRPNPQFQAALEDLGASVAPVAIYRWALPDDLRPLREAVRRITERECEVIVFTTSIQLVHLLEVAEETGRAAEVLQALREDLVVASVGPVMNAALADYGIEPDIVPAHPKMGILIRAASESAAAVLARKRHPIAR